MNPSNEPIRLYIQGIGHIPSKKNAHYPLNNGGLGIDKKIKARMSLLENAVLSQLYSLSQTTGSGTPLECLRQLQTRLSGLSDDSVREIPQGDWKTLHVAKGGEGVNIFIEEI